MIWTHNNTYDHRHEHALGGLFIDGYRGYVLDGVFKIPIVAIPKGIRDKKNKDINQITVVRRGWITIHA